MTAECDRNDTYNICYAHAIRSILAVSLIQPLEFREEQQERQQRSESSPERFGGGDVEHFRDPGESRNILLLVSGCALFARCKVLDNFLRNIRGLQRELSCRFGHGSL